MIEEMCKHVEKPLVFPLSNPTSQAEITAENAYKYSKGRCIFAGGKALLPQFPCCNHPLAHTWQLLMPPLSALLVQAAAEAADSAAASVLGSRCFA